MLIQRKEKGFSKALAKTPKEVTQEVAKQILGEETAKEVLG